MQIIVQKSFRGTITEVRHKTSISILVVPALKNNKAAQNYFLPKPVMIA